MSKSSNTTRNGGASTRVASSNGGGNERVITIPNTNYQVYSTPYSNDQGYNDMAEAMGLRTRNYKENTYLSTENTAEQIANFKKETKNWAVYANAITNAPNEEARSKAIKDLQKFSDSLWRKYNVRK